MTKIETNVVKPEIKFFFDEKEYTIIDSSNENFLDQKIKSVEDLIAKSNGRGKSEEEKDELYKNAQELLKDYVSGLRDTKYNFYLNRIQWKFLTDLIITKLEYDVNTIFFAIELTDLLGSMRSVKFADDKELISFPVNATEITYIYHLISKYKLKGLTKDTYTFSEILLTIGGISKLFNYYDGHIKNLSGDIQDWVSSFEEGVSFDKVEETV
jgi:hypothetical protein